jgi:putative DNA methylase
MNQRSTAIPARPKIETDRIPIEWLHDIALREGNSKKPVYRIHKWWARRLGTVFRTLIILATTPSRTPMNRVPDDFYSRHTFDDLTVLDPFMGGGTSIVEASKFGAKTIGVDIDPVAWFTTKKEIEPCPKKRIRRALVDLEQSIGNKIQAFYQTQTADGKTVPAIYYFWVDLITCPNCATQFEAHPHYQLFRDERCGEQTVFCKVCHSVETIPLSETSLTCQACQEVTDVKTGTIRYGKFNCPQCNHSDLILSTLLPENHLPKRLFAVEYETKDQNGMASRYYKAADMYDLRLFEEAEHLFHDLKADLPFPRDRIPTYGRSDPRPTSHGYYYYYQLFNPRQLLCMSLLYREIIRISDEQVREYLLLAFSDSLSSNNLLCSYAFDYRKLTPLFGLHAFNVVNRPVENNVWGGTEKYGRGSFVNCVKKVLRGKDYAERPYETVYKDNGRPKQVFTGEKVTSKVAAHVEDWYRGDAPSLLLNCSSTELDALKDKSIDLVLTDPPYYDNLSYSELSDFFYVWLRDRLPLAGRHVNGASAPYLRALYVNGNDDPSHFRFVKELTEVFAHCRRVLRVGGLMVFTFHHRDVQAWDALARALFNGGFVVTNVFPVRSEGKSGFHSTAGTIKWDSVLTCRPKEEALSGGSHPIRGFLRAMRARHDLWKRRLWEANLAFGWADSVSLGYALALQQALMRAQSANDVTSLLSKAAEYLAEEALGRDSSPLTRRQEVHP